MATKTFVKGDKIRHDGRPEIETVLIGEPDFAGDIVVENQVGDYYIRNVDGCEKVVEYDVWYRNLYADNWDTGKHHTRALADDFAASCGRKRLGVVSQRSDGSIIFTQTAKAAA